TIVGFKVGRSLVDELDVLSLVKAQQAWRKIIARMRYKVDGLRNRVDVTTTPEGFKFVFQQFVKQLREKPHLQDLYGLVQASTYDNEANLPDDYIDSLMESYPPQLIAAYLRGQFVNLTSGTIYTAYDRTLNASPETVQPGEPIYVGMDFNVGKMAAVVHVKRLGLPHAVDEIVNGYDTPDMIRQIKERFWLYADGEYRPTRQIRIYPDASGDSRKSVRASETDIALLKQAGFVVSAPAANPPVKDRINSMNAMFCNAKGERRYRVNPDRCPTYADALEQQVWGTNGEPDKSADIDHPNDAGGYFIHKEYPITKYSLAGVS
ncbi:TPA: terminase family protein, partial [Pseudomonas aeruginosa]